MKISCLGWGSLVWDPRTLPIRMPWYSDGPLFPVEFARKSSGDRITLVIAPGSPEIRVLWALMSVTDLDLAKKELAEREGIKEKNIPRFIGHWSQELKNLDPLSQSIAEWGISKDLDAVIWTALRPNLGEEGGIPSIKDVIDFLESLPHERRKYAEEYIRNAPRQIDTNCRRLIEKRFGWTPITSDKSSA